MHALHVINIYGSGKVELSPPKQLAMHTQSNKVHTRTIQKYGFNSTIEYSCNKYCDLIGHSEVSTSRRDLQV